MSRKDADGCLIFIIGFVALLGLLMLAAMFFGV